MRPWFTASKRFRTEHGTSQEPSKGRGSILAAQTTGSTDGDKDVAVPIDASFRAAKHARQQMVALQEPGTGPKGWARRPCRASTAFAIPELSAARGYARPTDGGVGSGLARIRSADSHRRRLGTVGAWA
jgi:hypothetical protein